MTKGAKRNGLASVAVAALAMLLAGSDPVPKSSPGSSPARKAAAPPAPAERRVPADDTTFRPTVLVRRGTSQGSGSVIASVNGETLVLTVAHVVENPGDLVVEVHHYNLGVEGQHTPGPWPRVYGAQVIVADSAADVAILRVRGHQALPYVARIAEGDYEPARGTVVTSVGIDLATHLSSWKTSVYGLVRADLKKKGVEQPFLVTDRGPEHGRSGGGLFLADGRLVGVCVGRVEKARDRWIGIFAPVESINRLIREAQLEPTIARSENWHIAASRRARSPVTETDHQAQPPSR
ncbi:MAG TPA: serine protease [Isosphaeraceae bacterium]|jgi:S1-C subfamily serine protease|nr:serine protease [Isosphaeraceae bacterium]